ncbi:unnamed protein product, partial [Pleuronectes platessa]
ALDFSAQGVAWPISRHYQLSLHASSSHHLSTTVLQPQFSSASQHTTPAAPAQHLAVDERCIPGMDLVDCLADYLVGLRLETGLTLTNLQASTINSPVAELLPYDPPAGGVCCTAQESPDNRTLQVLQTEG